MVRDDDDWLKVRSKREQWYLTLIPRQLGLVIQVSTQLPIPRAKLT
jgi:hypothetical protein